MQDSTARVVRRLGLGLAAVGVLAALVGTAWLAIAATERAVQMTIGGLIMGLVGALLLLMAPDKLPPSERGGGPRT